MQTPEQWFAWHPVRCKAVAGLGWHHNGGWVWLRMVWRHRSSRLVAYSKSTDHWTTRKCWAYYIKPEPTDAT
jgi:hypothetical protein